MYSTAELEELFDQPSDVISRALDLYFEQLGGVNQPPYSQDVADQLDRFFTEVNQNSRAIAHSQIPEKVVAATNRLSTVLGTEGLGLSLAAIAAREGVAIARLEENMRQAAYAIERGKIERAWVSERGSESDWLADLSENRDSQSKLLSRMGLEAQEIEFTRIVDEAIARTSVVAARPNRAPMSPKIEGYL